MPKVTENTNKDFKQAQTGMQPGRIFKIIDLGTQQYEYKGTPKKSRQLQFGFELPEDLMNDGRPLSVSKKINLTIGDKAALTKLALACTGVKPTIGFDPIALIGKVCNLTLVAWSNGEKSGVGIEGFSPLLRNQQVTVAINPAIIFDLDKFDKPTYDGLHDYYKDLISKSPEYQEIVNPISVGTCGSSGSDMSYDTIDQEIPF